MYKYTIVVSHYGDESVVTFESSEHDVYQAYLNYCINKYIPGKIIDYNVIRIKEPVNIVDL